MAALPDAFEQRDAVAREYGMNRQHDPSTEIGVE
jgi:hypothetical protein